MTINMNNVSLTKEQRILDKYRNGTKKLYDLCDAINKKAMNWYTLHIEFSAAEVDIITNIQLSIEETAEILKDIEANEDTFNDLDLGYDVFQFECEKCKGKLYVERITNSFTKYDYNKYKCTDCGASFFDEHPNNPKQIKEYYEECFKSIEATISLKSTKEEAKINLRNVMIEHKEIQKTLETIDANLIREREELKEMVLLSIGKNGEKYKEILKYKNYFDKT